MILGEFDVMRKAVFERAAKEMLKITGQQRLTMDMISIRYQSLTDFLVAALKSEQFRFLQKRTYAQLSAAEALGFRACLVELINRFGGDINMIRYVDVQSTSLWVKTNPVEYSTLICAQHEAQKGVRLSADKSKKLHTEYMQRLRSMNKQKAATSRVRRIKADPMVALLVPASDEAAILAICPGASRITLAV